MIITIILLDAIYALYLNSSDSSKKLARVGHHWEHVLRLQTTLHFYEVLYETTARVADEFCLSECLMLTRCSGNFYALPNFVCLWLHVINMCCLSALFANQTFIMYNRFSSSAIQSNLHGFTAVLELLSIDCKTENCLTWAIEAW
jgi:hypothetical protein